ncbi:MAG: hypothetical protein QXL17_04055 [Candidatus Thermoplasmatota archaeon]
MKTLGVYTKDFSLYHDIISLLKRRKLAYVVLSIPVDVPDRIKVILTSERERKGISAEKVVAVDSFDSVDHAIDVALQMLTGKELYTHLFIGIDPGERPGVAVVGDGILLQKLQVEYPEKVSEVMRWLLKIYPSKETCIRIGHGSILIRNRIINSLIHFEIPIEIVDETKTTSSVQKARCERDGEAAAAIALLSGGRVQQKLPLELSKGSVKNVQRKSRQLSDGRFTISEKRAVQVLKGEISLAEAVEQEEKKHRRKRRC